MSNGRAFALSELRHCVPAVQVLVIDKLVAMVRALTRAWVQFLRAPSAVARDKQLGAVSNQRWRMSCLTSFALERQMHFAD